SKKFTGIERYAYELALRLPEHHEHVSYLKNGVITEEFQLNLPIPDAKRNLKSYLVKILLSKYLSPVMFPVLSFYSKQKNRLLKKPSFAMSSDKDFIYHNPNYFVPEILEMPSIITIHDVSHIDVPQYHSEPTLVWLTKNLPQSIERSNHIITVSEFTKRRLVDYFKVNPETISVTYNGISEAFKPYSQEECHSVLVKYGLRYKGFLLSVGTIEPRKNIDSLLSAFEQLPTAEISHFPLVLVGKSRWKNKQLLHRIQRLVTAGKILY
ncbi:unnamed protein product, partial [marine sediment metagenome]